MAHDSQRLVDWLTYILQAIERIEQYTGDMSEVDFLDSRLVQDAVIRNFEIIGEASHDIEKQYPAFAGQYPELPLSSAWQMRNALAHGYFKVDFEVVWQTIQRDLPDLYRQTQYAQASVQRMGG